MANLFVDNHLPGMPFRVSSIFGMWGFGPAYKKGRDLIYRARSAVKVTKTVNSVTIMEDGEKEI